MNSYITWLSNNRPDGTRVVDTENRVGRAHPQVLGYRTPAYTVSLEGKALFIWSRVLDNESRDSINHVKVLL